MRLSILLLPVALLAATPASAQSRPPAVSEQEVRAHMSFLAGEALAGRASASRDEAIAAAYVASRFESYGLKPAPGASGYTQQVALTKRIVTGPATLTVNGKPVAGLMVLTAAGGPITGTVGIVTDQANPPAADVLVATDPKMRLGTLSRRPGVKMVIAIESDGTRAWGSELAATRALGLGLASTPPRSRQTVVALPAAALAALKAGDTVAFDQPFADEAAVTTNAVGYLPGTDPAAGVVLLTAHLDHIGRLPDGKVMTGANDDASGTVAVLELARVLAAGKPNRRGILFVAYGAEEVGGLGSRGFIAAPPVPLGDMVANLEFEMIGQQDPKLPAGTMMMTGYERSTFGEELKAHGALVTADPYPEQNFFARSDNYSLALQGVVAHTVSGWATVPTYHTPNDTNANIDFAFMTRAIGSLVAPMRNLANARTRPTWKPGGRPTP